VDATFGIHANEMDRAEAFRNPLGEQIKWPAAVPFCLRQSECGHLSIVADKQGVADEDGVIPRLAFNRLKPPPLFEGAGRSSDEGDFSFFRHDQEQVLVFQQENLTAPVASAPPNAIARRDIHANEIASVESVYAVVPYDEIAEVGLQSIRSPDLFRFPFAVRKVSSNTSHSRFLASTEQDIAAREKGGLDDPRSTWPIVVPEKFP
jgi:hypothetical protein